MMTLLPAWRLPCRHVALLLLLACLCAAPLGAQDVMLTKLPPPNDSIRVDVRNLPPLKPFNADTSVMAKIAPYYSFLYVFGDGNFVNRSKDSSAVNRYVGEKDVKEKIQASVYATGKYSDEKDPPPKRLDTLITGNGGKQNSTNYTKGGALFLQKNHTQLVPGKTTVWILTLRNPKKVDTGPISGMVYLFHDSPVEQLSISKSTPADTTKVPSVIGGVTQYGQFGYQQALFHFPEVYPFTYGLKAVPSAPLNQTYKKALVWQINSLEPGMERHLFIEIANDTLLLDKFSPENLGSVKFMAVFVANSDNSDNVEEDNISVLTPAKQERVNQLNLPGLFSTDTLLNLLSPMDSFPPGTEFPFPDFTTSTQIIDFVEVNTLGSRSNDPNFIRIESCTCPPDSPGAQKLYCTVNFVNDGNGATNDIYISVEMPPMIDMNSAFDELLQLHPALQSGSSGEVIRSISGRTVTWHLKNFMLFSSVEMGEGHPSTYGFISFTMLTLPGTDVNSIPEMQACIVFDGNDPVCTLGAKVTPLSMVDALAKEINQILECQDGCEMPPQPCPWWVWVLIALGLLLLILLIRWWRNNPVA